MSSSGGGGKGVLSGLADQTGEFLENARKDPWGTFLSEGSNLWTAGTTRYNNNTGKFEDGSAIHNWNEGWGEVTGANKARAAGYLEADNLRTTQAKAALDLANKQLQDKQADVNASNQAKALRGNTLPLNPTAPVSTAPGYITQTVGSDQRDFLGL